MSLGSIGLLNDNLYLSASSRQTKLLDTKAKKMYNLTNRKDTWF